MEKEMTQRRKKVTSFFAILRNETLMWLLLVPTVFALVLCLWNPIIRGIIMSFFSTRGFKTVDFVGFRNYINVLSDTMFLKTLWNTVQYVLWSLVIGIIPPLGIAIAINEAVHAKQTFKVLAYVPAIAPSLATSIIWKNLFSPAPGGLLNQLLLSLGLGTSQWLLNEHLTIPLIVVTMTWSGYATTMLLYLTALQSLSQDLYEAAVVDGAGIWRRIFKITLPHLAPTMLLLIVRQIIGVFSIFNEPFVMTDGGPNNASLTIGLTTYRLAFTYMSVDRSLALGVVSFCILIFATLFYFKMEKKLQK